MFFFLFNIFLTIINFFSLDFKKMFTSLHLMIVDNVLVYDIETVFHYTDIFDHYIFVP